MSTATQPLKKPAPPPPSPNGSPAAAKPVNRIFTASEDSLDLLHKVVLYGPGGVGKSELASLLLKLGVNPVFIDIGESTKFLKVKRAKPNPQNWEELRAAVQHDWSDCGAIVIDDFSKAEEFAVDFCIRTIKHEKGDGVKVIKSIEDYGFGKGYVHVYETFLTLLGDLDAQARRGKHIICIAHECTANVPNPRGEDWLRYEPRLQSPPSGKSSIRHRVKEWCDHMFFVGFDVFVDENGVGVGAGTRSIYTTELPSCMAKSRSLSQTIRYEQGNPELWKQLLAKD